MGLNRNINDDSTLAYLFNKTRQGASDALGKAVEKINDALTAINNTIASIQTALNNKVSKSGDTMTGNLTIARDTSPGVLAKVTNGDITVTPGTSTNSYGLRIVDKNNVVIGMFTEVRLNDGNSGLAMYGYGGDTNHSVNTMQLLVDKSGNKSVYLNAATAWRSALGLGTMATVNSPVPVANGGTGAASSTDALANLGTLDFKNQGTALAAGKNIDTDLEFGVTYYSSSSTRTSELNGTIPVTAGFQIIQKRAYGSNASNYNYQFLTSSNGRVYYRHTSSSGVWQSWESFLDSGDLPLSIANGGTGLTASPSMLTNLASTTADTILEASPRPGITGTLAINHGGTGQTAVTTESTTSKIATAASGVTISKADFAQWGKLAIVRFELKKSSAISSNTLVATMVSGKRPAIDSPMTNSTLTDSNSYILTDGKIYVNGSFSANTTLYLTSVFMLA